MNNKNNNILFEEYISKIIHPKYKYITKYNVYDNNYLNIDHHYFIKDRVDLTYLEVYSIDPENCSDVDDAFSIELISKNNKNDEKIILYIHIADPTSYFNPLCKVFNNIKLNCLTHYPSNKEPLHLMPKKILNVSNLMINNNILEHQIKQSLTLKIEINTQTYLPLNYQLLFSKINVKKTNKYSYDCFYDTDNITNNFYKTLNIGLKISKSLREKRNTKIEKMKDFNKTIIKYDRENKPYLYNISKKCMDLKVMIEEFAIYSNSVIGEILQKNITNELKNQEIGIFRNCNYDKKSLEIFQENDKNSSSLLKEIITNQIQAKYDENKSNHDLINTKYYSHFTSPLRRCSDLICHFLLKNIYLEKKGIPKKELYYFNQDELKKNIEYINQYQKKERKIQFLDNKVNTIYAIYNLFEDIKKNNLNVDTKLNIKLKKLHLFLVIKFISYEKGFLNFIITNVIIKNEINELIKNYIIHISYCLKSNNYKYLHILQKNEDLEIEINKINHITIYDKNIFPNIENVIYNIQRYL